MPSVPSEDNLAVLKRRLSGVSADIQRKVGQYDTLGTRIATAGLALNTEQQHIDEHEQATTILSELEKTWRGSFEEGLASVAGEGLSAVFNKDMVVGLETTTKRSSAFTDITLTTDGLKTRVKGAKGGSVAQVFAAQLRQLMTLSHRPEGRRLLALDEPFSMVSVEFRPALCAMLREMSTTLGFQWLFSSHEEEMLDAADVAYRIEPDGKGTPTRLETSTEEVRV